MKTTNLLSIFTTAVLLSITAISCGPSPVTDSEDLKLIKSELISSYNSDSVAFSDYPTNLEVYVKSNLKLDDFSADKLESLILKVIGENYKPTELDLNKKVTLELEDVDGSKFTSSTTFKNVFALNKLFKLSFEYLSQIFTDKESTSIAIDNFKNTPCFSIIMADTTLSKINITGIVEDPTTPSSKDVHIMAIGESKYSFYLLLDHNNEVNSIFCENKLQ